MNEEIKVNKEVEAVLDYHFPKGHKWRGQALVLTAIANCEIDKAIKETKAKVLEIINKIPINITHNCGTFGIHLVPDGCTGKAIEEETIDKEELKQEIEKI